MRLSRVQRRRFSLRCDIYAPNLQFSAGVLEGSPVTLVASDVPCQIDAEVKNSEQVPGLGQSDEYYRHAMDRLRVPMKITGNDNLTRIVMSEGWYVHVTSGLDDANDTWYSIQQRAQLHPWKLGTAQYLMKASVKPPINMLGIV
jgi:hypothetical protein